MKKLIILAVAFGAFTFASCKKSYTCSCTINGQTTDYKSGSKLNKKDAKTWCNAMNVAGYSCSLK